MSKTQTRNNTNTSSLAAAFSLAKPSVDQDEYYSSFDTNQKHQQYHHSLPQASSYDDNMMMIHSISSSSSSSSTQQEQQENNNKCSCNCSSADEEQVEVSPYINFTRNLTGPTFISVFSSVSDILPHANVSAKGQVPWKCSNCDADAYGHKCPSCFRSRDSAALRVFMGQLSKEGDVELVTKMLEVLCPELPLATSLLHVEPHTHANSGRGKGCAWVYVSSLQDVLYIVKRLHKRTYPTANAQNGEVGFVAFPDSYSENDIKAAFDNDMACLPENVTALFHRSPITAEVPLSLQRSLRLTTIPSTNNLKKEGANVIKNNIKIMSAFINAPYVAQHQQQHNNHHIHHQHHEHQHQEVVFEQPQQQQVQEQQVITPNNNKQVLTRYRWNPYSATSARVYVH